MSSAVHVACLDIYTDGGCWPNPGPGAWAFCIFEEFTDGTRSKKPVHQGVMAVPDTTNNRMEMQAVIEALKAVVIQSGLHHPEWMDVPLRITSDSSYVVNGLTVWLPGWEKRGLQYVKNGDLWTVLGSWYRRMAPEMVHVRGHQGIEGNEICDALCTKAQQDARRKF